MFVLFGFVGQTVYNKLDARHAQQVAVEMGSPKEKKDERCLEQNSGDEVDAYESFE